MKLYLTDQSQHFPNHLESLKRQTVTAYDISKLTEKTSVVSIETSRGFQDLNTAFLFDYQIFPGNIMTYMTQWSFEKRQMQTGDTIVQQAFISPIRQISQKFIFGVRIKDIIKESTKIGFSYETLTGHAETGVSIFTIEKTQYGTIVFKVHTFSKPAHFLTRLAAPIFIVPYQAFCTQQALKNVKRQLENC